ncbi:hypothetical protein P5673_008004, partial [Acropora cervicornis]
RDARSWLTGHYIWHALRLRHYVSVPRSQLASIIKEIDPQGIQERRSRWLKRRAYVSYGPSFCWHLDSSRPIGGSISSDMCESIVLELGNVFHMECLWFCFSKITGTVIISEDHVMIQLQGFLTSFITYLKIQALLIALFLFLKPE